ncbi:hypothetical protein QQP08_013391 [Theobroma cacao]|nr:hypothetical protein QQP08_013391 [Theobroma cacao]
MAGYGWNSRHANMHRLHHERLYRDTNLFACRVCGDILMGKEALFDHVELHLLLDESAAIRQILLSHLWSAQSMLFTNHFSQNLMLPTETGPFSIRTYTGYPDLQWAAAPSPVCFGSRNDHMLLIQTQQPTANGGAMPRNQCFTRPFLNQLERTLLDIRVATIMDRETATKFIDQQMLDVNLKLGREDQD